MGRLVPVECRGRPYPKWITPQYAEVSAHFDVKPRVKVQPRYCLHTESSTKKRSFSSPFVEGLEHLGAKSHPPVPELWLGNGWVDDFVTFIKRFIAESACGRSPGLLEIHPPFRDYCCSVDTFLVRFRRFAAGVRDMNCGILIENRNRHSSREFLLSNLDSVCSFAEALQDSAETRLKFVIDIPQLLNAEAFDPHVAGAANQLSTIFSRLSAPTVRPYVGSIHLHGRKGQKMHQGNLDDLLGKTKPDFLCSLRGFVEAGGDLYFLPELPLGTRQDVADIVRDLQDAGIGFLQTTEQATGGS
jgi:hypothetical protein